MNVRKLLFWFHLVIGMVAGIIIFTLCGTGLVLTFEKELVANAERNVREVKVPSGQVTRLSVAALLDKLKETQPELKPGSLILFSDPRLAVQVSAGRPPSTLYVDPYTGTVSEGGASLLKAVMRWMINCHRYLGAEEPSRAVGKAFTGGVTLIMLVLVLTGLYLWMPKQWTWAQVKTVIWFQGKWKGKARDWNWHHVVGLWMAPILVVLTVSGVVLSYKWASDLVFKVAGNVPPAAPGMGATAGERGARSVETKHADRTEIAGSREKSPTSDSPEKPGATEPSKKARANYDIMVEAAQKNWPNWEQITIRMGGGQRGGQGAPSRGAGEARPEKSDSVKAEPVVLMIREKDAWPKFATVQATFDSASGALVSKEGYADYNTGRRWRTWLRWLHTGEALGLGGKILAALGCAGGMLLVWTGVALTVRRFTGWWKRRGQGLMEQVPSEPDSAGI